MAVLLVAVMAEAQEIEMLEKTDTPADAMLGKDASVEWRSRHVVFSQVKLFNKNRWSITIGNTESIFNKKASDVIIGYYNDNDSLLWKLDGLMGTKSENMQSITMLQGFVSDSIAFSHKTSTRRYRVDAEAIMKNMERGGYIRIVSPLYNGSTFDVRCRMPKKE